MPDFAETSDTSPDETPKVELKPLPATLRYEYLGANQTYPVIINASLGSEQAEELLCELRKHRKALGYTIGDLKGISPSIYMQQILMEDDHQPTIEGPREDQENQIPIHRKDHFHLPFIDQLLERLAKHNYFYYLDGYSDFFQIPIHRKDHFHLPFIDQLLERTGTFKVNGQRVKLYNSEEPSGENLTIFFTDAKKN